MCSEQHPWARVARDAREPCVRTLMSQAVSITLRPCSVFFSSAQTSTGSAVALAARCSEQQNGSCRALNTALNFVHGQTPPMMLIPPKLDPLFVGTIGKRGPALSPQLRRLHGGRARCAAPAALGRVAGVAASSVAGAWWPGSSGVDQSRRACGRRARLGVGALIAVSCSTVDQPPRAGASRRSWRGRCFTCRLPRLHAIGKSAKLCY